MRAFRLQKSLMDKHLTCNPISSSNIIDPWEWHQKNTRGLTQNLLPLHSQGEIYLTTWTGNVNCVDDNCSRMLQNSLKLYLGRLTKLMHPLSHLSFSFPSSVKWIAFLFTVKFISMLHHCREDAPQNMNFLVILRSTDLSIQTWRMDLEMEIYLGAPGKPHFSRQVRVIPSSSPPWSLATWRLLCHL